MLDFSLAEIGLIVAVAVVFIGPKELPVVIKATGKALRTMKSLSRDIKVALDEVTKETGLHDTATELQRDIHMIRGDDGKMYEAYMLPTAARPMPKDEADKNEPKL